SESSHRSLYSATLRAEEFVPVLTQHLLDAVDHRVELVFGLDLLTFRLVLGCVRIRFLCHALDFFLGQSRRRCDGNLLVLACGHVFRRDIQDPVGIDVECHLDLRYATGRRRQSRQVELAQCAVLRRHRTFTLQHVHFDGRLVVRRGGKRLRLARRNRRVTRNHRCRYAAQRLDREGQRSDIEQQQVFHLTAQHTWLNSRAHRNHFIWVYAFVRLFSEQLFDQGLDAWHAGLTTNQHHFVNLVRTYTGILQGLFARTNRALNDVFDHRLKLRPGQFLDQVFRPACIRRDERQVDLGFHSRRDANLAAFSRIPQPLHRHLVAFTTQGETFILLDLLNKPVHDALIDVVAPQMRVAIRRLHLDHAFTDLQHRDV